MQTRLERGRANAQRNDKAQKKRAASESSAVTMTKAFGEDGIIHRFNDRSITCK